MAKHVFVQKEKHKSTGTTLLHDNDSIELSVSSPCSAEHSSSSNNARRIITMQGGYCCGERDKFSCFSSHSSKKESKTSFPNTVRGLFQRRKERYHFPSAPSSSPCEECTTASTSRSSTAAAEQNFSRRSLRRRNGHKGGSSSRHGDGGFSYGHVENETVVVYPKVRSRPSSLQINMPAGDRFRKEEQLPISSSTNVSKRDTQNNDSIPPFVLPVGSSSTSSEQTLFLEANTPLHSNKTLHFHSLSLGNDSQTDANSISKMEDPPQETYFSMTDFAKHNWVETIMSNSSTTESLSSLGFLSIMAATVVIHPMLFVTGAATAVWAVGVVHAVEKGYEFFTDGQFQNMFWADAGEEATAAVDSRGGEDDDAENAHEENSRSSLTSNRPHHHLQPQKQRHSSPTMTRSTDDSILSSSPFLALPPSPPLPVTPHHSSQYRHPTPQDPSILAHFPPLENQLVTAEFPGLNALEFFHVFFSDHAPYSWKEFQQSMGDVDIDFGTWNKLEQPPNLSNTFHPYVQMDTLSDYPLPSCSRKERICTFKTLTKSYFGPAYASARKIQRVSKFSTRLVILENKTELFDIPFSDRFFVLERWIIESTKHDANFHPSHDTAMKYTTRLSVSVQVFMRKPCNWEKQIRSKTLSTMTDLVTTWSEKATQALDLTLRRKLERMRVRYETHNGKSLYSFQSQTTHQDANNLKSPSDGSVSSRTVSSLSFLSNNRMTKSRGASMKKKMPETSEQELMRMHQKQLKLLEEKIASGDLEWCSIETKHCLSAGKGLAFARVLDQERNMLTTSPSLSPKKTNCNDTKKNGKKSDNLFKKWAINGGVKGVVSNDDKRTNATDVKGLGSVKKRLILRRNSDAAT